MSTISKHPARQKKEKKQYTLGKHVTPRVVVKIGKILTGALASCLLFILISALYVMPNALTLEQKDSLHREFSSLSSEEIAELKEFFDYHFFFSDFAYTFFGTKPMSIGRLLPTQINSGWAAWEKISKIVDSEEFVIRKYKFNETDFVLVANLKTIKQIYDQNRLLFEEALKGRMNLDSLIHCLKEDGPLFQELMQDHLLLGILLGYGAQNAKLFSENQNITEKKVAMVSSTMKIHPIFFIFSQILPVSFACDPTTEETQELNQRYEKERKAIHKIAQKNPLFLQMLRMISDP